MKNKDSLLPVETRLARGLRANSPSACLSPDMLLELARHGKKCRDYETRLDHAAHCAHCFALLQNFSAIEQAHEASTAVSLPAALQRFVRVQSGGVYEAARRLPAWSLALLQQFNDQTQQPTPAYRSVDPVSSPAVRLIAPSPGNRAMSESPDWFEWEPMTNAQSHEVVLEEAQGCQGRAFRAVPDALIVEGNTAQLRVPLKPGYCYRLRFTAILDVDDDWTVSPPVSVYLFERLNVTQARQVEWARTNVLKAPVASAMILCEMGLYEEAAQIARAWKPDEDLHSWRAFIEQSLEARRQNPAH